MFIQILTNKDIVMFIFVKIIHKFSVTDMDSPQQLLIQNKSGFRISIYMPMYGNCYRFLKFQNDSKQQRQHRLFLVLSSLLSSFCFIPFILTSSHDGHCLSCRFFSLSLFIYLMQLIDAKSLFPIPIRVLCIT